MKPTKTARSSGSTDRSRRQALRTPLLAMSLLALAACSSDDDNDADNAGADLSGQFAFVATRAADFSSGRIDSLSLAEGNIVVGNYPGAGSDIAVVTDGVSPYQIGRFLADSVTRYDARDTSVVDYQYSVLGDEPQTSNPQDLAFSSDSRAYLTRRLSTALWVVDPSAETEADFLIEEIDLSAYDTDMPDMTDAIIVDDKLFVLLERLELQNSSQLPVRNAYIAVINTLTNMEIDTGQGNEGLFGIELDVRNPTSLQYNDDTGMIYVTGRGNYFESEGVEDDFHSGGVVQIDPSTYEHALILDDGTDDDNQGYFVELEVIDAELAFLLTFEQYTVTTLRRFNPTSGELSDEIIPALQDVDITTLALGPDDHLWIGINDDNPGFYRMDIESGELAAERVATELVPMDLVFIDVPETAE